MKLLRPLKDMMRDFSNMCPLCGKSLSIADFSIDVKKTGFRIARQAIDVESKRRN